MSSSGVRQKSHSARSFLFLLPNDWALRPGLALPSHHAQGESDITRGGEGAEDHQLENAPDIRHL